MDNTKFLEPKEIEIDGAKFIISKMPAIQAQQAYGAIMRECKDEGDIGMTYLSEQTVVDILKYAALKDEDSVEVLEDIDKINFACPNVSMLIKLEAAMIRYNFGFLFNGTLPKVLETLRSQEGI